MAHLYVSSKKSRKGVREITKWTYLYKDHVIKYFKCILSYSFSYSQILVISYPFLTEAKFTEHKIIESLPDNAQIVVLNN